MPAARRCEPQGLPGMERKNRCTRAFDLIQQHFRAWSVVLRHRLNVGTYPGSDSRAGTADPEGVPRSYQCRSIVLELVALSAHTSISAGGAGAGRLHADAVPCVHRWHQRSVRPSGARVAFVSCAADAARGPPHTPDGCAPCMLCACYVHAIACTGDRMHARACHRALAVLPLERLKVLRFFCSHGERLDAESAVACSDDIRRLEAGQQVVVGTPGRVYDMINRCAP